MSWILFGLSALVAVATLNALWPVRRPWWLKLPSFNAGWFANELPVHLLAGHTVVVVVLAALGALDERPGQVGVALSAAAAVGLVVLAAAHQRAGNAMDEALRRSIGPAVPSPQTGMARPVGRCRGRGWSGRGWPGLVRRELSRSPAWSTRSSLGGVSSSTCTGPRDVGTAARCSSRSMGADGSRGTAGSKRDR